MTTVMIRIFDTTSSARTFNSKFPHSTYADRRARATPRLTMQVIASSSLTPSAVFTTARKPAGGNARARGVTPVSPTANDRERQSMTASFALATFASMALSLTHVAPVVAADNVFEGSYYDPNHPGCPRDIDANGVITGLDPIPFERGRGCRGVKKTNASKVNEKFNAWKIQAKVRDDSIDIDFDQKDGSGEKVTGKWNGVGIELPDGTVWVKKTGAKSDAWTPL